MGLSKELEEKLRVNHIELVNNMDQVDCVVDHLYAQGGISGDCAQSIRVSHKFSSHLNA